MHFYGIWGHFEDLEVDNITWGGSFSRGADSLFGGEEARGALILTGVENTDTPGRPGCNEVVNLRGKF
jgi:hypothetical protein